MIFDKINKLSCVYGWKCVSISNNKIDGCDDDDDNDNNTNDDHQERKIEWKMI